MTGKKMFCYALLTAILAGVVTLVTWQMSGWPAGGLLAKSQAATYISFVSWAAYFLFGANVKGAINAFCSIIAGIISAILMFILSLAFGFVPWWAVPLAVTILVLFMMYFEKIKPINNVAAVFLGTGIYFGLSAAGAFEGYTIAQYALVGVTQLIYVLIGFAAGWLTIQFNIICSKMK
jgi:hypothetical protein